MSSLTHPESERARERRDALLDAAQAELLAQGYGGTTLASVARRAQVSTATLHKYFATKRALFGGVMERFWSGGSEPPSIGGDVAESLRKIGRAYAELLLPPTTPALFRVVIAEAIQHPELGHELYERGKRPYLERLEALLTQAVAAGLINVPDVPLAVRQFLGMINDVVFWPRLLVPDLEVDDAMADAVVSSAVETFLARYAAPHAR